jgi:TonB family protein
MKRSGVMTLILITILLVCWVVVFARQEKTSSEQTASKADKTSSGEVDRILEDLKLKREDVVDSCLENCEEPQEPSKNISGGGFVTKMKAAYPPIAVAARATGKVLVRIVINEEGKVIAAQSISGHPLLQAAAVRAARESTFNPYLLNGAPTKVIGTLTYKFVLNERVW